MTKSFFRIFFIGFIAFVLASIVKIDAQTAKVISLVNTSHLDHLFQKVKVDGKEFGIVHIYADYPDYHYVEAKGEGIACVDDAARAMVFYIKYFEATKKKSELDKIKMLTNFLLYMQAGNGFFYNFIWKDYSRDTTYRTSVAEPNWWTWRAIWALSESQKLFQKHDKKLAREIKPQLDRAVNVTLNWMKKFDDDSTSVYGGFILPDWLPYETASDQAAILVKALSVYYQSNKDHRVKTEIEYLCKGIMKMHAGDENNFPNYAFLSWQNTWHMWGNSQSDALIEAGQVLHKPEYIKSALKEINYFYPALMKMNYLNNFTFEKKSGKVTVKDSARYSQIAYGIRPMVFACIRAYKAVHDVKSAKLAGKIASWFFGKNILGKPMYNPKTGVCFDGIENAESINKNSGAESTIEALLSLVSVEQNPIAKNELLRYYNSDEKAAPTLSGSK